MSAFETSRKIADAIEEARTTSSRPWISFEFFPPKTEHGIVSLKKCIQHLMEYDPLFLDVTWGAGGSTSALTLDLVKMTKEVFGANPNMHLTCTNMDVEHIHTALDKCKEAGICNILALRGDPPVGQERWTAADVNLSCAADLVKYIREHYGDFFSIAVAGYPEGHPNAMTELPAEDVANLTDSELTRYCKDTKTEVVVEASGDEPAQTIERPIIHVCRDDAFAKEMEYLKSKIDLGARFIVTQMFFDVEVYGTFVAACRQYGINVPVVPGIMCISNYGGFKRMIKFCKTRVQQEIMDKMEELKDNAEAIKEYGIQLGVKMCQRLQELGAPGFHFYTLNTSHVTIAILEGLGYHRVKEVHLNENAVEVAHA